MSTATTRPSSYAAAMIPDDMWIALDGDGQECVFSPGTSGRYGVRHPRAELRRGDVSDQLWDIFARALPDRGYCEWCTATECEKHCTTPDATCPNAEHDHTCRRAGR